MSPFDDIYQECSLFLSDLDGASYAKVVSLVNAGKPYDTPELPVPQRVLRLLSYVQGAAGPGKYGLFEAVAHSFPKERVTRKIRAALLAQSIGCKSSDELQKAFGIITGIVQDLHTNPADFHDDEFVLICLIILLESQNIRVLKATYQFLMRLGNNFNSQKIKKSFKEHVVETCGETWSKVIGTPSDVQFRPVISVVVLTGSDTMARALDDLPISVQVWGLLHNPSGEEFWETYKGQGTAANDTNPLSEIATVGGLETWIRKYLRKAVAWVERCWEGQPTEMARIEFFLPYDKMELPVDEWEMGRGPSGDTFEPIGILREVVVRLSNRFDQDKEDFEQSAETIRGRLQGWVGTYETFSDQPSDETIFRILNARPSLAFLCSYNVTSHGVSFWKAVIDAYVPCGLWFRSRPHLPINRSNMADPDSLSTFIFTNRRKCSMNQEIRAALFLESVKWPPVELRQQGTASGVD